MCWGHGDAPETDYIKCFIYLKSYYITPWSWVWHGRVRDTGSKCHTGAGLSSPWSSAMQSPLGCFWSSHPSRILGCFLTPLQF